MFYDQHEWAVARKRALHAAGYKCQRCGVSLVGLRRACHVHHKRELRRSPSLRSEPLNLVSLCRSCHTKEHNEARRKVGCDEQGRPLDANHPWNKAR
jgi:5-methylcytosine-specific restriction protein A